MRKVARPIRKKPADYPQMAFRVSAEDKTKLEKLIDEVYRIANGALGDEHLRIRKNELIVDALWKGLLDLKKNHRRLGY